MNHIFFFFFLARQTTSTGTGAAVGPSLGTDEAAVENLMRTEPALAQLQESSFPIPSWQGPVPSVGINFIYHCNHG